MATHYSVSGCERNTLRPLFARATDDFGLFTFRARVSGLRTLIRSSLNRSTPNLDLATEFLESYALTEEGLTAMDHAKPIGVPALISLYEKMAPDSPNLRQLKAVVDAGQVMPNIPQMGRFFTAVGTALQIATEGHASPEAALREAAATMRKR